MFYFMTLLLTAASLFSTSSYAQGKVSGEIVDVFMGEVDPFVLGDRCILFIKGDDHKDYGLVLDDDCFSSINLGMVGQKIVVAADSVSYFRDREAIRILKRYDSKFFYLEHNGDFLAANEACGNVQSLIEAQACFKTWSNEQHREGDMENSIGVTDSRLAIENMKKIVAESSNAVEATKLLSEATYLAVVNQHYDEDEFTYYVFGNGMNPKMVKIYFTILPDLYYDWPTDVLPIDFALGLTDLEGWHYDEFEEAMAEARDQ